tara:strand:- start:39057 stop:39443 length:387 start_codon:yes stop_codon:yes gene_type:complete
MPPNVSSHVLDEGPCTAARNCVLMRIFPAFPSHTVISMPALSPTMTAGNIGAWQKKVGDSIAPGDVLVEIETDKAQMDFEFQEEGTIARILRDAGEKDVAVGSVSHTACSIVTMRRPAGRIMGERPQC